MTEEDFNIPVSKKAYEQIVNELIRLREENQMLWRHNRVFIEELERLPRTSLGLKTQLLLDIS